MAQSVVSSLVSAAHESGEPVLPELPRRGQIWAAHASAMLPVLEAAAACSAAGLSVTMQTDKDRLERGGTSLPQRPCIIIRSRPDSRTVDVVIFTTLGRGDTPISTMNPHFQHFAIAVEGTAAWPAPDSWVLECEPHWRTVPQYVCARVYTLPYTSLLHRYSTCPGGTQFYNCSERTVRKLDRICSERTESYTSKQHEELSTWNDSYEMAIERFQALKCNSSHGLGVRRRPRSEQLFPRPYLPYDGPPAARTPCPSFAASPAGEWTSPPSPTWWQPAQGFPVCSPPPHACPPMSPLSHLYYPASPSQHYHPLAQPAPAVVSLGVMQPAVEIPHETAHCAVYRASLPDPEEPPPPLSDSPLSSCDGSPERMASSLAPSPPLSPPHLPPTPPSELPGAGSPGRQVVLDAISEHDQDAGAEDAPLNPRTMNVAERNSKIISISAALEARAFVRGAMFYGGRRSPSPFAPLGAAHLSRVGLRIGAKVFTPTRTVI